MNNSRERILALAISEHDKAHVTNSAALRELDQLLMDLAKYVNVRVSDEAEKLIDRLAQAGYGEK